MACSANHGVAGTMIQTRQERYYVTAHTDLPITENEWGELMALLRERWL